MSREEVDQELAAVEAILGSLDPAASSLDFAQVMYRAGRASAIGAAPRHAGRIQWVWPFATAVSLLLAAVFAAAWTFSGKPEVVRQVVDVEKKAPVPVRQEPIGVTPAPEASQNPWREYARLRHIALSEGIEGLPEPQLRPLRDPAPPPWAPFDAAAIESRTEG